jgi:hypothetical protein
MKSVLLLLVALASAAVLTGQPAEPPSGAQDSTGVCRDAGDALIRQILDRCDSAVPLLVSCEEVAGLPGWFVARVDTERDWWGTCVVFRRDASGAVEKSAPASVDGVPWVTGQYVRGVGSQAHSGVESPLIWVLDGTHMGNGYLCLMRLEPETGLVPVCMARQRLNTEDGACDLSWTLEDVDGDGMEDLLLDGVLIPVYEPWETGPGEVRVRKVFLFDPGSGDFRLDASRSEGLGPWDAGDSGYPGDAYGEEVR